MSKKPRNVPNWLKDRKKNVDEAILKLTDDNQSQPKRRLRSNYSFEEPEEEDLTPVFNVDDLEFVKYEGSIEYCTDFYSIAEACDQIIKFVDKGEDKVALGFDMEWSFSWKTGPDKTAVIQICTTLDKCYVFHIYNLAKIPQALSTLLHHDKIILHGVNIKSDLRKLERDLPIFKADKMIGNCIDLGMYYNEVCSSSGRWSLERLAIQVCKLRISKDRKIRMSKWHFCPLTDDQKMYAAIDVYISQLIYQEIEKRKVEESQKYSNFFKVYDDSKNESVKADDIKNEIADLLN